MNAFFWSGVEIFLSRAVSFLAWIWYAKQLGPELIGYYAPFAAGYMVLVVILDGGYSEVILRKASLDEKLIQTINYQIYKRFFLICSSVLSICTVGFIVDFISWRDLSVISILLLALLFLAFITVPRAEYQNASNFKKLTYVNSVSALSTNLLIITLMAFDPHVEYLALQLLFTNLFASLFCLKDIKLKSVPLQMCNTDRDYSNVIFLTAMYSTVIDFLFRSFLGFFGYTSASGYFSQSIRLIETPIIAMVQIIQRVNFQKIIKNSEGISTFLTTHTVVSSLFTPFFLITLSYNKDLVNAVLGDAWTPMAPALSWVCASYYLVILGSTYNNYIKSSGDSRLLFIVEFVKKSVLMVCLILCVTQLIVLNSTTKPHVLLATWFFVGNFLGFIFLHYKFCRKNSISQLHAAKPVFYIIFIGLALVFIFENFLTTDKLLVKILLLMIIGPIISNIALLKTRM